MDLPILFEDPDFFVVNKPAGIVVDRSRTNTEETIQDWMEEGVKSTGFPITNAVEESFRERAGIVHRLDKETTGCLVIAKTPLAFSSLQKQFKDRSVVKTYLALVHGAMVPQQGEIRAPVDRLPWHRERFGVVPGGKEAVSSYTVLDTRYTAKKEAVSLVEVHPATGRTHQIRVHMKYAGHPLVADYLYAGRKTNRLDRQWAPRVMLHAWKISFLHPGRPAGERISVVSPVPADMGQVLRALNFKTDAL